MSTSELAGEIEKRFEENALPSLWIKLFKNLKKDAQAQLLHDAKLASGEIPIFGGVWWEANKRCGMVAKERVWLLVTSQFVYWGSERKRGKVAPAQVLKIEDLSPKNRHFLSRGYFGLRRFILVLEGRRSVELPCKGGGAVSSVWKALALLCVRHRQAANLSAWK